MAYYATLLNKRVKGRKPRKRTLGARDFSSAVSGFCQVFIVTRAKSFSRGFGLQPEICRPPANIENSRRTREKPLVPRVKKTKRELRMQGMGGGRFGPLPLPPPPPPTTPSQCTIVYAKKQFHLFYITYDVLYSESTFSGLKLRNYLESYLIKCYCQSIKLFGQHS